VENDHGTKKARALNGLEEPLKKKSSKLEVGNTAI
jgi:hypothetical protein